MPELLQLLIIAVVSENRLSLKPSNLTFKQLCLGAIPTGFGLVQIKLSPKDLLYQSLALVV